MPRRAETRTDEAGHPAAMDADNHQRQEKRQAFNSAVAAGQRLVRVSVANQKKRAVVQKADKEMDEHKKERVYRRGVREAARGPAVRAADAAGKPISYGEGFFN